MNYCSSKHLFKAGNRVEGRKAFLFSHLSCHGRKLFPEVSQGYFDLDLIDQKNIFLTGHWPRGMGFLIVALHDHDSYWVKHILSPTTKLGFCSKRGSRICLTYLLMTAPTSYCLVIPKHLALCLVHSKASRNC